MMLRVNRFCRKLSVGQQIWLSIAASGIVFEFLASILSELILSAFKGSRRFSWLDPVARAVTERAISDSSSRVLAVCWIFDLLMLAVLTAYLFARLRLHNWTFGAAILLTCGFSLLKTTAFFFALLILGPVFTGRLSNLPKGMSPDELYDRLTGHLYTFQVPNLMMNIILLVFLIGFLNRHVVKTNQRAQENNRLPGTAGDII